MKEIKLSDITMQMLKEGECALSFREKIELAKLLDRLGVAVIEIEGISEELNQPSARVDQLRIKSIASAVKNSTIAVPVRLCDNQQKMQTEILAVKEALKEAVHPRLQVRVPVSSVQMEYLTDIKTKNIIPTLAATLRFCKSVTDEVELVAEDATRADRKVLRQIIQLAADEDIALLTLCDAAGCMLPNEFQTLITKLKQTVPVFSELALGVCFSNALAMADACAMAALSCGAVEIKGSTAPSMANNVTAITNIARVLEVKSGTFQAFTTIRMTEVNRLTERISGIFESESDKQPKIQRMYSQDDEFNVLTAQDDVESIAAAVEHLGYDLSEEENTKVFEAFSKMIQKKERLSYRELDAIVATAALRVPSTYEIEHYTVNTGNAMTSTSHIKMIKKTRDEDGRIIGETQTIETVCMGDGPIDASFRAIEQIAGSHYELDDFQISAVTRGREAMGEAVVKLRGEGKIYSGRGISTDIIRASIDAYLSALNKIVFENADRA